LWVIFVFHQTMEGGWRPTAPSRLGATPEWVSLPHVQRFVLTLLACRWLSWGIRCQKEHVILELGGLDLVDGTPVVDIKPYLPFAESLPMPRQLCAGGTSGSVEVTFSEDLAEQLAARTTLPALRRLLPKCWRRIRVLPTVNEEEGKTYAVWLLDLTSAGA
jgi:hypothetical protein